jgi:hypothetical protein
MEEAYIEAEEEDKDCNCTNNERKDISAIL